MRTSVARVGAAAAALVLALLLLLIGKGAGGVPPLAMVLDPVDGLYRNARNASGGTDVETLSLPVSDSVTVRIDERGVPHIFANDLFDAARAMGYLIGRDRLFQYDFITRVASGRLSELMGSATLDTDRFLRNTGMDAGARLNAQRIIDEQDVELRIIEAYCDGLNAYIDALDARDLPIEFRLLGGRPTRCDVLQVARLIQYMTFDLSYQSDEAEYGEIRKHLGESDFALLYPQHSYLYVPIVGDDGSTAARSATAPLSRAGVASRIFRSASLLPLAEGFREGKGSNNWAVDAARSTTGAPILAGDMHLALTLPAVWYEVHLVTPDVNTYGVTIAGAPLPVEAFNDHIGWAFTNTGSDQIDHYALELDDSRTRYRFADEWRALEPRPDTIFVAGGDPVVDTLWFSHWGPVFMDDEGAVAVQWVAHKPNRTIRAIYEMNAARDYDSFEDALRYWDAPMQNILYAGNDGTIAIRSTGHLPVRRGGHGMAVPDGSSPDGEWIGRVPFEELPRAINPPKGYLTSTNQQPATPAYLHYLGFDWRSSFRSLRAEELLSGREQHSVDDFMRYQADVVAAQHHTLLPFIDTLQGLSGGAAALRDLLREWDGTTDVDRAEPLILDELLDVLADLVWDEEAFQGVKKPALGTLLHLMRETPQSVWFDVIGTPEVEHAADVLRTALARTHEKLLDEYGQDTAAWRWGDHHQVIFRHITSADALQGFWRGPYEYPGFRETLSPASDRLTTHSASWRVVVDFSTTPPAAFGIYPGGQSGDPLSPLYDRHIDDYIHFRHYRLNNARTLDAFPAAEHRTLHIHPAQ